MKEGLALTELAQAITQTKQASRDFVAPARVLHLELENDVPVMTLRDRTYPLKSLAHRQLSSHLHIPAVYYDRLLSDDPELLCTNVNRWLKKSDDRRLLRTFEPRAYAPLFGLRAYLSNKYRPLDNMDLADAVLPVVFGEPWSVKSCALTETRFYLKVVCESIGVEIEQKHVNIRTGGHTHIVHPGFTLSNSEVGLGSLQVLPSCHWEHCHNLALMGSGMRRNHVGKSLGGDGDDDGIMDAYVSDETRQLEDRAVWSRVTDLMRGIMVEEGFRKLIEPLQVATADVMGDDPEAVVEVTAKTYGLTDGMRKSVLQSLMEEGDYSRYGLSMAITAASQQVEDYDTATDLERLGGQILELPRSQWRALVTQATKA